MKIHKILFFLILSASLGSLSAMEEQDEDDALNFLISQMSIQERSLSQVLKNQNWLNDEEHLISRPILPVVDEAVGYYGNVPPTSLYKQGKVYFLPTAPIIHTYNPIFSWGYVDAAYSLRPTDQIKKFFGKSELVNCFLVFQKLIDDKTPQLLRLHGFIHGTNAGAIVDSSVQVAVELMSHEELPITFSNKNPVQTNTVHCHGGVASPSNFDLIGVNEYVYTSIPLWQSLGVYLPATRTATLIVMGQNILDQELSSMAGEPILDFPFNAYLERLLS